MSGMFFLPPIVEGLAALFGVGTPAEDTPEPAPEPTLGQVVAAIERDKPRADVPTLADAVADIRRDMRNSLALQSRSAKAPPPIIVVNWVELVVVMDHVDATLETETP